MDNEINDGGQAFPRAGSRVRGAPSQMGMSLRDYFAAKAMEKLLAGVLASRHHKEHVEQIARRKKIDASLYLCREAYDWADWMLEARKSSKESNDKLRDQVDDQKGIAQ